MCVICKAKLMVSYLKSARGQDCQDELPRETLLLAGASTPDREDTVKNSSKEEKQIEIALK